MTLLAKDQLGVPLSPTASPAEPETPTVLLVDDHRSFAELLSAALTATGALRTVGIATTAAQAVGMAAALRPDLVVMDLNLPGSDGVAATRKVRQSSPESVVVVLTAHTDPEWIARAAQAGASAFVGKSGSLEEIIDVLRGARQGRMLVSPSLYGEAAAGAALERPTLSARELEVVGLLAQAKTVREIAAQLKISEHTCRGYVKFARQKLGVASQLEAVVKAQQLGLIDTRGLD